MRSAHVLNNSAARTYTRLRPFNSEEYKESLAVSGTDRTYRSQQELLPPDAFLASLQSCFTLGTSDLASSQSVPLGGSPPACEMERLCMCSHCNANTTLGFLELESCHSLPPSATATNDSLLVRNRERIWQTSIGRASSSVTESRPLSRSRGSVGQHVGRCSALLL